MSAANVARASVLGVLNSLADALEIMESHGVRVDRVLLIGGGSKSRALRQAAASVFGVPVECRRPASTWRSERRARRRGRPPANCQMGAADR